LRPSREIIKVLAKLAEDAKEKKLFFSNPKLPSKKSTKVSESKYESLKTLESIMKLVTPSQFTKIANDSGLRELETKIVTLASGKPFFIGTYAKNA